MTIVELEYPKIERIEGDERYAKFACEPLPPDTARRSATHCAGCCCHRFRRGNHRGTRRGVAPRVLHHPVVKEDVVKIVLTSSLIRLRCSQRAGDAHDREGSSGVATAGDIITTSEIEIVNPEAPIATLEPEASLWMSPRSTPDEASTPPSGVRACRSVSSRSTRFYSPVRR